MAVRCNSSVTYQQHVQRGSLCYSSVVQQQFGAVAAHCDHDEHHSSFVLRVQNGIAMQVSSQC